MYKFFKKIIQDKKGKPCLFLFYFLFSYFSFNEMSQAFSFYTETGLSFSYKKSSIDEINSIETQGLTGSVSFYLWERVALEVSYTNGLLVKKERQELSLVSTKLRVTTQFSDIYESNLLFILADRNSILQPFIKTGIAFVKKRQVVQVDNDIPLEITQTGWAPSGGLGFKIRLSEAIGLKASYDILRTPIDSNTSVDDLTGRLGISWVF